MTIEPYISYLVSNHLFVDFNKDQLRDFFSTSDYSIKSYGKEDIIFIEDDVCSNLSIVLKGEVEIQKIDPNGKVLTVARFKKGDTLEKIYLWR